MNYRWLFIQEDYTVTGTNDPVFAADLAERGAPVIDTLYSTLNGEQIEEEKDEE